MKHEGKNSPSVFNPCFIRGLNLPAKYAKDAKEEFVLAWFACLAGEFA